MKTKLPNNYFPHDFNSRYDRKIQRLRKVLGLEGYGMFWMLIETLCTEEDFSYPLKDLDLLADEFGCSVEKIEAVVKQFDLFKIDNEAKFFSLTLIARLQKYLDISEKARKSIDTRWENARELKGILGAKTELTFNQQNKLTRSQRLSAARNKGTHTKEEWEKMKAFFDNTCVKCFGATELNGVVRDHIIPIYQGGSDGIDNIQPLCAKCNASKGAEDVDYRLAFCERKGVKMPTEFLRSDYVTSTIIKYDIKGNDMKEDKRIRTVGDREIIIKDYFLDLLPIDSKEEFIKTWVEWVDYKKEKKQKLTLRTAKMQVKFLLKQPDSIKVIEQSIEKGWQGLFELNSYSKSKGEGKEIEYRPD